MHGKVRTKDKHAGHSQESKGWKGSLSTALLQRNKGGLIISDMKLLHT